MRYLRKDQLANYLDQGKTVEQWLGYKDEVEYVTIKWLKIEKERDGQFSVVYFESFDEGDVDFVDIYEFSAIDPDFEFGKIDFFNTIEDAIFFAVTEYHASDDKFVNIGVIQDVYLDYLDLKKNSLICNSIR